MTFAEPLPMKKQKVEWPKYAGDILLLCTSTSKDSLFSFYKEETIYPVLLTCEQQTKFKNVRVDHPDGKMLGKVHSANIDCIHSILNSNCFEVEAELIDPPQKLSLMDDLLVSVKVYAKEGIFDFKDAGILFEELGLCKVERKNTECDLNEIDLLETNPLLLEQLEPSDSFAFSLRKYQKQALSWLVKVEEGKNGSHGGNGVWKEYSFPDSHKFYRNELTRIIRSEIPDQVPVRGGILADEMVIFLILGTRKNDRNTCAHPLRLIKD
jgi:hypothetical protein